MGKSTDFACVQRVMAGDLQAFTAIVSNYGALIRTVVGKIVENREDAEDITQEVFIKVFKSLEQFRAESEFSTWLYRIAYNTALSELRKKKLHFIPIDDHLSSDPDVQTPESDDDTEIQLQHLEKALKQLPPDEIFLVTLYYIDNQSVENISKITALSASNVKTKLYRIRKKLAAEIHKIRKDE
jgi:RNA polymerase sigma-70 factor (ECF subfamily)